MNRPPLTPEQVVQALAAINKGHQLEGQRLSPSDLDRGWRILSVDLSPERARAEMAADLEAVREQEHRFDVDDLPQHSL